MWKIHSKRVEKIVQSSSALVDVRQQLGQLLPSFQSDFQNTLSNFTKVSDEKSEFVKNETQKTTLVWSAFFKNNKLFEKLLNYNGYNNSNRKINEKLKKILLVRFLSIFSTRFECDFPCSTLVSSVF
jgi:hypothetical protein